MILQRLKTLWRLSGEMQLLRPNEPIPEGHLFAHIITPIEQATVVPYKPRDPVKEIIGEKEEIV